ncbi:hypothetical protein B0A48_12478 [Cryoendolithus antarcticus]|uniref:Uncharacterized protein n=1 Tax=Cryoendolithus antarcticus TaxID=1507870 RepID=A0A1V8SS34_9PEZI|nr:hypothetical protein B0A48_12478 [Cryoendolithus antarcticus]
MLMKGNARVAVVAGFLISLTLVGLLFIAPLDDASHALRKLGNPFKHAPSATVTQVFGDATWTAISGTATPKPAQDDHDAGDDNDEEDVDDDQVWHPAGHLPAAQQKASDEAMALEHIRLATNTSLRRNGTFFPIVFPGQRSYNPNIIPHPSHEDTYIIVAQRDKRDDDELIFYSALFCEAMFFDGELICIKPPLILPIQSTTTDACEGSKWEEAREWIGPHDTRIFYGVHGHPYAMFSSQAEHHCFGEWLQRLDRLMPWLPGPSTYTNDSFFRATDLKRPPPFGAMEKNWFVFWDRNNQSYLHYDVFPSRTFAKLDRDGSVGEDLSHLALSDAQCLSDYMPSVNPATNLEWIHQSTNSLAVTFCNRTDPTCRPSANNTRLFTLFQHKSFYGHGVYEPYIMVFSQEAPFSVYGISSKPLWFEGRGEAGGAWSEGTWRPDDQSQLLFVVSMNWRRQGAGYHGFLDDELFVSFGVEDQASGGAAVVVGDLLAELSLCE